MHEYISYLHCPPFSITHHDTYLYRTAQTGDKVLTRLLSPPLLCPAPPRWRTGLQWQGNLCDSTPGVKLNQQRPYCNYIWLNGKASVGVKQLARNCHPDQVGADRFLQGEWENSIYTAWCLGFVVIRRNPPHSLHHAIMLRVESWGWNYVIESESELQTIHTLTSVNHYRFFPLIRTRFSWNWNCFVTGIHPHTTVARTPRVGVDRKLV